MIIGTKASAFKHFLGLDSRSRSLKLVSTCWVQSYLSSYQVWIKLVHVIDKVSLKPSVNRGYFPWQMKSHRLFSPQLELWGGLCWWEFCIHGHFVTVQVLKVVELAEEDYGQKACEWVRMFSSNCFNITSNFMQLTTSFNLHWPCHLQPDSGLRSVEVCDGN